MALAVRVSRRSVAIGLAVIAAIAVAFVTAALWNPWRYTVLYPLAQQGGAVAALVLAGALVATAVLVMMRTTVRGAVIGLIVALVAIPALCVGLPVIALRDTFRPAEVGEVLAVSPGGDFSVVKYSDAEHTRVYVRSRAGLFSREATVPVAECAFDPFARGVPPEAVRFTSETTIAVPVNDEPTTVVRFDQASLQPEHTVSMCPGS